MLGELFFDTETTGTDPARHQIWEIGAVKRMGNEIDYFETQILTPDLSGADKKALEICRFYDRYDRSRAVSLEEALIDLIDFSKDTVLFGLNVSFDITFLQMNAEREDLLFSPAWHYSPVDVKSYASGALGLKGSVASHKLADMLGVRIDERRRHSALGDAELTLEIYDKASALVGGANESSV